MSQPLSPRLPGDETFVLLTCSPRAGGNCDTAARAFAQGFAHSENATSLPLSLLYLRRYRITPCSGCGYCAKAAAAQHIREHPGVTDAARAACPLAAKDDAASLLHTLATAKGLCLVAPIYFYHLPAQTKALLDRTQVFWSLRDNLDNPPAQTEKRRCHIILLGAREKGKKLFAGSLLSLKYALKPMGFRLAEPILLYGLEHPGDLAAQPSLLERIAAYGQNAALALAQNA